MVAELINGFPSYAITAGVDHAMASPDMNQDVFKRVRTIICTN